MRFFLLLIILGLSTPSFLQLRVEPMHWWAGMKDPKLQLLVHGEGIGSTTPVIRNPQVTLKKVHKADSPNYLFIDLQFSPGVTPGIFAIQFVKNGKMVASYNYQLYERRRNSANRVGFNSSDVMYLITPDRFANGDPSNDVVNGMREEKLDRKHDYGRHGGDIRGIINNLDYIQSMGFTSIWPTPMLENDMKESSYHGYAITDHYKVDPRMGTLAEYMELGEKCDTKGIKLVFDGVANHTGINYWWMKDLPFKNWINYPDSMQNTNHRRTVNQDPYASQYDSKLMVKGWFVRSMPDVNHDNPFLANYIIQNNIWWIEKLMLKGIRQDTYPYSQKKFLEQWSCRIMNEYPQFGLVGEEWTTNPLIVAYWQKGKLNSTGYKGCMGSTMDFPMQAAMVQALTEPEGWNTGLVKFYEGLANDFVYASPKDLLIFGDNHDMDRLFTQVKSDAALHKMALTWLLTSRGIPQVYYGTEVLIQNNAKPGDHGLIRTDFPGGWQGDAVNAFTGQGLSEDQKDVQDFTRKMLNWRKHKKVIHSGNTRHFAPDNGVYVYFRYDGKDTVMAIMNKNVKEIHPDIKWLEEMLKNKKQAVDVLSGRSVSIGNLVIPARSAMVFEIH
jgi:neopullulanase